MPIDSNDLNWWHAEDGFMLRYGRRAQVIVRVVQEDSIYPNMWRVEFVDRTLSDSDRRRLLRLRHSPHMRRGPDSAVAANLMTRFIRKTEFVCILPPDCRYSTWIAAHCPVPGRSQRMAPHCLYQSEKGRLLARARVGRLRMVASISQKIEN